MAKGSVLPVMSSSRNSLDELAQDILVWNEPFRWTLPPLPVQEYFDQ